MTISITTTALFETRDGPDFSTDGSREFTP
jgi:hypothetical protein